jgi:hypothetical protein
MLAQYLEAREYLSCKVKARSMEGSGYVLMSEEMARLSMKSERGYTKVKMSC